MVCIKNKSGRVVRVNNDEAAKQVATGQWAYCPKSEWKAQVRAEEASAH